MITLSILAGVLMASGPGSSQNQRMAWWRDSRFGLFIHWGLYSVPAGRYKGKTDQGEWIMESSHIPVEEYEKYVGQFNPTKFNADTWAAIAKDAGMRYVVITTKHHDGFDLFDSKVSRYTMMHTPYKKDIMALLSKAVRKQGLHMGWYHSIMDWHHPDYTPARPWNDRQGGQKNLDKYSQYLYAQVRELLTNYGKIDVMWFDGEWESSWQEKYAKKLFAVCRECQPAIIVNNRVSNARGGSMESTDGGLGDYLTPEQTIPEKNPGTDWETCMTMNDHWGWNEADKNWKSPKLLVQNLVDLVSKGGNYLLNVGPKADGTFPEQAVKTLHTIGQWMKVNGEAIYGTTASVFDDVKWGRCTVKRQTAQTTLYFHVFQQPAGGKIVIPGIGNKVLSARILGGEKVHFESHGFETIVTLPKTAGDLPSVVKLIVKGAPIVFHRPTLSVSSELFVTKAIITVGPVGKGAVLRYTLDGTDPTNSSSVVQKQITVDHTSEVRVAMFYKGARVSEASIVKMRKVVPLPAQEVGEVAPGLQWHEYEGKWATCPDWSQLVATQSGSGSLTMTEGRDAPREYYGRVFTGYLKVPLEEAYLFELTADDGAKLTIDGTLVIDNDGLHSSLAKTGSIALAAGYHAIKIEWFNASGSADLRLSWAKAGTKLHPLAPKDICHE